MIHDYAWACDNGDWGWLKSIFTDDADLDYTTTGGPAGSCGRDRGMARTGVSQLQWIHHVVSNFQIDLDGDRADVRAMFHCSAQLPGLDDILVTGGYYDEKFACTADGWKIERLFEDNRWMKNPAPAGTTPRHD